MPPFLINNWRLIVVGIAVAMILWAGWYIRALIADAEENRQWDEAVNEFLQNQKKTESIGLDLNHGNNIYRPVARELDRKVQDATVHSPDNRFDADSVQRTKDRIAAGEAARQRLK